MDNSSKRKFSLDSKSSSGQYDLRFTRRKLNTNYKWCCCGIASFLLLLLLAAVAVYFAYYAMANAENDTLMSFRASFRVLNGDSFDTSLIDTNSTAYRKKSRSYRELINLLVRRSEHRVGFVGSEILALDGVDENGMLVHLKLHFDRQRANVTAEALRTLFFRLFNKSLSSRVHRFNQLTFDPHSLYIGEPGWSDSFSEHDSSVALPPKLEVTDEESVSAETERSTERPRRVCVHSHLAYCRHDNFTSYPNLLKHLNTQQVNQDLVRFREIVDSECYPEGAYDFVCSLLQPPCAGDSADEEGEGDEEALILPCRATCEAFMQRCETRLSPVLIELLDCSSFPLDC